MAQFQLQPAPFREPAVDDEGRMTEQWRRFFLSTQALVNQILATLAATTEKPGLMWGDEPEAPEFWIQPVPTAITTPGPQGAQGLPGRDGEDAPDENWLLGFTNNLLSLFTQGSVLFAGPSGVISQDNAKLFWDDVNFRLGIGIALPLYPLHVSGGQDIMALTNTDATKFVNLAWDIGSNHVVARLYGFGASYASSGRLIADSALFEATQPGGFGMSAASASASATVRFYTATLLRMTIFNGGGVTIGDTTDPGNTNLRIAGTTTPVGQVLAANGSAAAPSLSAANFTNSGIYFVATGQVLLSSAGLAGLRYDANGDGNISLINGIPLGFAGGTSDDVFLSRLASGSLQVGTTRSNGLGAITFGTFTHSSAEVDKSYQIYTPLTGATITMSAGQQRAIIDPAAAIAALTITLPPSPVDGQIAGAAFTQAVTLLTVNAPGGATVKASLTSAAIDTSFRVIYQASNTTWYPSP